MRLGPLLTPMAPLLLGACTPGSIVVAEGGSETFGTSDTSGTSSETGSADTSTTETAPPPMQFAAISIANERLCAITLPDRRLVCRDRDACDRDRNPGEWELDDPACWLATALPDAAYVQVELSVDRTCALREADGGVDCDSGDGVPEGIGFVDLDISPYGICATDGNVLDCGPTAYVYGEGFQAVDDRFVLMATGVIEIEYAAAGCPPPNCGGVAGEFIAVAGGGTYAQGCGLRSDGDVECYAGMTPIDDDRAIAEVELGEDGSRCVRFATGEVECSFGSAPPADDLVEIEIATSPAHYACGIRSDGTLACWGEPFMWCAQDLCAPPYECWNGACIDCSSGCEACDDDVCVGLEACIYGECVPCIDGPCVECGSYMCIGGDVCLGDECFDCGDGECTACGDTYCVPSEACVDGGCRRFCEATTDCDEGDACVDGVCTPFGVPVCDESFAFLASELETPNDVRGTPLTLQSGGAIDLVVAGATGAWVVGGPALVDATQIATNPGVAPLRPAVADFDDDGDIDIALASVDTASVAIFDNDGAWTPLPGTTLPTADGGDLVAADADGDGLADIFFAYYGGKLDNGVSWHRNLGGGLGFVQEVDDSSNVIGGAARAADLDRDGLADFAACDAYRAKMLTPATSDSLLSLQPFAFEPNPLASRAVAIGDFDGDGNDGVALVQFGADQVWIDVWREPAEIDDETHAVVSWTTPDTAARFALTADLDADGDDELLVPTEDDIVVWRGSGSLASPFECVTTIPMEIAVERITAADFDGDGVLDLVVSGDDTPLWLLASG